MDFIYCISAHRNGAPEIFYFTYSYDKAIIYLYEFILKEDKKIDDDYSFHTNFYHLNKFPLDFEFTTNNWSEVKMTKTCKFRIKFENWGKLKKEYISCKRNEKLYNILGE